MLESNAKGDRQHSWMDEAHRRADSSEDAAWAAWNAGATIPRAELSAAAVVAVAAFAWFTLRGAVDVSSNPWQGLMLGGPYPVPLFAEWFTAFTNLFEPPMGIVVLNVLARLAGAFTCAGIAAFTVNAARRVASPSEAWVCGVISGGVFLLAPGVTSAFTSAWPGAITVPCAVWGLAALSRAAQSRLSCAFWLTIGAVLCGAAMVSHAFFGWLAVPVLGVAIFAWRHGRLRLFGALSAALTWLVILALPLVNALAIHREPPNLFLGRVLRGAYPAVAERAPDWHRILDLGGQFHPLVWILAAATLILAFQRHARLGTGSALALFMLAGPLAPFLMNDYDSSAFVRDEISIEVMALAGFVVLFGLGLGAAMQVVFRQSQQLGYRAALAGLIFGIVALHQWGIAPDRRSDLSGAFAQSILDGCPRQSILIVQDPGIAGMLNAAQHAFSHRMDVEIVPLGVLLNPAARHYYQRTPARGLHVDAHYDTQAHAATWQHERPLVTNTLLDTNADAEHRQIALDDLILWEFVRDNFGTRPIAFAGADADWLLARAAINGLVQVYPRAEVPLTDSIEAWLAMKVSGDLQVHDPELNQAFSRILLSLSATRRAQNQGEDATRLARLATQYQQDAPYAWLALARAAARNGSREEAQVFSETGRRIGNFDATDADAVLQEDFDTFDLVAKYETDLTYFLDDPDARFRRQGFAADLWMKDEIAALAGFMQREIALEPRTARDLYEMAATQAQLGNLEAARSYLVEAVTLAPDDVGDHLKSDGRFALLELDHQPSSNQTSL